jgi:hypothetical protein
MSIQSTPGAAVTIDNAPQGATDARGNLVVQVKPGSRALGITLNGYQPYAQTLNLKNGEHNNITATLNPIPRPAAPTPAAMQPVQALFSASVTTIQQGQSTTLNWQTANASGVSIDNGIGEVSANGQKEVSPASNTTYELTAKGSGGTQQKTISITVTPKAAAAQPAAPAPAAPQPVEPSTLIQQAINSFDAAYNAHDVGRIQATWTGVKPAQAKALQSFFKDQPTSKVSDSCSGSDLSISGNTASWNCTETSTFVSGGRTQSHAQSIRFTFAERGGAWTIVDRR